MDKNLSKDDDSINSSTPRPVKTKYREQQLKEQITGLHLIDDDSGNASTIFQSVNIQQAGLTQQITRINLNDDDSSSFTAFSPKKIRYNDKQDQQQNRIHPIDQGRVFVISPIRMRYQENSNQKINRIHPIDYDLSTLTPNTPTKYVFQGIKTDEIKTDIRSVYRILLISSTQTAASFLFECCPSVIIIIFLGRIQRDDLVAGYGLGIIWVDSFGMGFLNGLACGLETMISQAFGAKKFQLCGELYNRAIAIVILAMLPIFFIQYFGQDLLGLVISNQQMVQDSGIVTQTMIPAVFLNGIFSTTKCFLNGQNIYNYQFITQTIVTGFHIFWCYLFIEYLELGLLGASLTRLLTEILSNIILFSIIKFSRCSDQVLVKFQKIYFTKLWPFLKFTVPIGAVLWLEWVCYECYSLQASQLSEAKFGANVIMTNFSSLYYMVAYGISIAASTFIGSEMGKKQAAQAKKFAIASFVLTTIFLLVTHFALYSCREQFLETFTSDSQIQNELRECYMLLQLFLILDSYQAIATGIVRAIGKENFACYSFIFTYLMLGQSMSYLLTFKIGMSLDGVWVGMIIGASGYNLLQILSLIFSTFNSLVDQIESKINSQDQPVLFVANVADITVASSISNINQTITIN